MVGSELDFISLLGCAVGDTHDACIVEKNVQSLLLLLKEVSGSFDRVKVRQVQRQEFDFGIWDLAFDVLDCGSRFGFCSCSQVNLRRIVLGKL